MLTLTLLLAAGHGAIAGVGAYRRWQATDARLTDRLAAASELLDATYEQATLELERIALQYARAATSLRFPDAAPAPDLTTGLHAVAVLARSGRVLAHWERDGGPVPTLEMVEKSTLEIAASKEPVSLVTCEVRCSHHVFAPFIADGVELVAVGSRPLTEIVADYHSLAGVDLVILARAAPRRGGTARVWGRRVVAATSAGAVLPALRKADGPARADVLGGAVRIEDAGRSYLLATHPLPGVEPVEAFTVIVIDGTDQITAARRDRWVATKHGLASFALSGLLLCLALLRDPRQNPSTASRASVIDRTSGDEVARGSRAPEACTVPETTATMTAELNAVNALLDHAGMILILHTEDGYPSRINRFGAQLTGWALSDLKAAEPYTWLHRDLHVRTRFATELREVFAGCCSGLHHESQIRCADGSERTVVWRHRFIPGNDHAPPSVLSMGLDVTLQRGAQERLRWLAHNDPVTNLRNRRGFILEVDKQLRAQALGETHLALVSIHVDHFAEINKRLGFKGGDELLVSVGHAITEDLPGGAVCARSSGAQFLVLLPAAGKEDIEPFIQALADSLSATAFYDDEDKIHISTSIGVAVAPGDGNDTAALLLAAELAAAQARSEGRGRCHFYDSGAALAQLRRGGHWYETLETALSTGRIVLHYQPILDHDTWTISHYEALARFLDGKGKVQLPGEYLTAAEWSGHLYAIDCRVLTLATRAIADRQLPEGVRLAVNFSAQTVQAPNLLDTLESLFKRTGVEPERIMIEIVETTALRELPAIRETLAAIVRMGCSIAVDDFGVGFTSFEYLRELPIDCVKIDRSFTRTLLARKESRKLVRSMDFMAKSLGKSTIAEGVEDAETLAALVEMGVDYSQGYYIARPAAAIAPTPELPARPVPRHRGPSRNRRGRSPKTDSGVPRPT